MLIPSLPITMQAADMPPAHVYVVGSAAPLLSALPFGEGKRMSSSSTLPKLHLRRLHATRESCLTWQQ